MKEVIETRGFHSQLSKELTDDQIDDLIAKVAGNPLIGMAIPETGNIRYLDIPSNRKKAVRVCYLSDKVTGKVIMLGVYKTTETNLLNCVLHKLCLEVSGNA